MFPPSTGADQGLVCYKGVAVRELFGWCVTTFGEAAMKGAIATLPPRERQLFDEGHGAYGVLHGGWYPAPTINGLLDALLVDVSPAEQTRLARSATEATVGKTLRGIYGKLLRLLCTPALYAQHAQRVWSSYNNTGYLTVRIEGSQAQSSISKWPGHHPFVCRMSGESAKIIYTTLGQRSVSTVRMACVAEGAPACLFMTTWAP
jgi:hypothetical protein